MTAHIRNCGHDSAKRFWSFVDTSGDGCWPWIGAGHRDGYGRANVRIKGKTQIRIAHRMAWLFTYGKIPKHLDVCHTCDNRLCCRPEHLWLGTHKQNMADQKAKMRHIYGERNHKAKLTEAKAIAILRNPPRMGRGGVSQVEEYAKRYGVTAEVIYSLVARRSWKHIRTSDIHYPVQTKEKP